MLGAFFNKTVCRSNVLGTKFTVYDGGENPEKKPFVQENESVRQELAAVCYVSETCALDTTLLMFWEEKHIKILLVPGNKRAWIQRSQENDCDHPRNVRE